MKWLRNRRVYVTLELIGLAVLLGALAWALRDVWADAAPRLRNADVSDLAIAVANGGFRDWFGPHDARVYRFRL